MEAIFMGAITWAIIGICYMIYSEFYGSDIYGCDNVGYHWYLLYDLF